MEPASPRSICDLGVVDAVAGLRPEREGQVTRGPRLEHPYRRVRIGIQEVELVRHDGCLLDADRGIAAVRDLDRERARITGEERSGIDRGALDGHLRPRSGRRRAGAGAVPVLVSVLVLVAGTAAISAAANGATTAQRSRQRMPAPSAGQCLERCGFTSASAVSGLCQRSALV